MCVLFCVSNNPINFVIALFIDVGTNYSVLDHTNLSFIYEDVLTAGPNADGEFVSRMICDGIRPHSLYTPLRHS